MISGKSGIVKGWNTVKEIGAPDESEKTKRKCQGELEVSI